MKQIVLSQFNLIWVPVSGLMIFVLCFFSFFYWTYKKSNRQFYEEASFIPLSNLPMAKTDNGED